jgi:hypothetical protein
MIGHSFISFSPVFQERLSIVLAKELTKEMLG